MTDPTFDYIGGPPRYAVPDWDGIGTVARLWVPDAETVGWLVWQSPDRLAWISAPVPASSLGVPVRDLVRSLVEDGAAAGRPAREVWDEALARTLHTTPSDDYLPAFVADVRADQSAASE